MILKDVNQDDVKALLNFVYQGTVYISEKKLASFLRTAELLQIRGLAGAASTINTDLVSIQYFTHLIVIGTFLFYDYDFHNHYSKLSLLL